MNTENGQSALGLQNVSECFAAVMLLLNFNPEKNNVSILIENIIYFKQNHIGTAWGHIKSYFVINCWSKPNNFNQIFNENNLFLLLLLNRSLL